MRDTFPHFTARSLFCIVVLPVCYAKASTTNPVGTFWHISDLHFDFYYTQQKGCPWSTGAPAINPGPFGDYKCDSPWKLIHSTLNEMSKTQPQPDFILFTGDSKLHTHDAKKYLSTQLLLDTERNLTNLITKTFPNTKVFSALGNHDYYPMDSMPVEENYVRNQLADMWKHWMNMEQTELFKKVGYYSGILGGNLLIIILNTNLWDKLNPHVESAGDPGGQFAWLASLLIGARKLGQQVYIIGHHPPGKFELSDHDYWIYPAHNRRYVALVRRHADVIAAQFFAHNHRDSFRIFYDQNEKPISTLFITPSVTPHSKQIEFANNPGIRLYEYDRRTSQLLDYVQYYFDLVEANSRNDAAWQVEYRATSEFMTPDIGPASLHRHLRRLACADVDCDVTAPECEDNGALQRWSAINSVSYDFRHCDAACQRNHLCAMTELDYDLHRECVRSPVICRPVSAL